MALQPKPALSKAIQNRVARIAVGPSSVRGSPAGTSHAARSFFSELVLQQLADAKDFAADLDRLTGRLLKRLPRPPRNWGLARKLLNIFLRDCTYNAYLRSTFRLGRLERHLELPLDSITGRRLRRCKVGRSLPRWPGLIGLTETVSRRYQDAAKKYARCRRMRRVHLDVFWWQLNSRRKVIHVKR